MLSPDHRADRPLACWAVSTSSGSTATRRVLALDLGSSSARALVLAGHDLGIDTLARRSVRFERAEPGAATFDGDAYLRAAMECLDELQASGKLEGVSDVAVASQWHGVLAVDGRGRPLSPVITWGDTRAHGTVYLPATQAEQLRQRTGCVIHPMYWTVKVPWLRSRLDDRAQRFVGLPELLGAALLDDDSMSVSMASGTGLLDSVEQCWDLQALELAGLQPSQLPGLADDSWSPQLAPAWRDRWPSLRTARWHPATGDGAAANIGVGAHDHQRVAITVGTSAAVRLVGPEADARLPLPERLWRYRVDGHRVVHGAAFTSGGQLDDWLRRLLTGGLVDPDTPVTADRLDDPRLEEAPPGSRGLTVLPWHAGTRPPAPYRVQDGGGSILGLRLTHTAADVLSASIEGACFDLADGFDALAGIHRGDVEVVVNGGMMEHSFLWQRRLAGTLARPVHTAAGNETTARGAALVALGEVLRPPLVQTVRAQVEEVGALGQARHRWQDWARVVGTRLGAID